MGHKDKQNAVDGRILNFNLRWDTQRKYGPEPAAVRRGSDYISILDMPGSSRGISDDQQFVYDLRIVGTIYSKSTLRAKARAIMQYNVHMTIETDRATGRPAQNFLREEKIVSPPQIL